MVVSIEVAQRPSMVSDSLNELSLVQSILYLSHFHCMDLTM